MSRTGRPSIYTDKLVDTICTRLAQGQSMNKVCKDPEMPAMQTLWRWLREKEDFRERYERAKRESADWLADETLEISDEGAVRPLVDDKGKPVLDESGNPVYIMDSVAVAHAKLRVDTRKWFASKMKPKKYGDRTIHAGDEEAPLQITEIKRVIVKPKE